MIYLSSTLSKIPPVMNNGYRSREAPMDYQWTNRSPVKPAWAAGADGTSTPRKRPYEAPTPLNPPLGTPQLHTFGSNQNIPFLFQPTNVPQSPQSHPWQPPPQFSPSKAFPSTELKDIDMTEASPLKNEPSNGEDAKQKDISDRPFAAGALRRVFRKRREQRSSRVKNLHGEDEGQLSSGAESEDEGAITPLTQNTSNHYTLNMPAHPAPQSDVPYVLLGYLQFFFNLSLILIFLYLFVQFIITVQKDVEHRIFDYSQEIIQEVSMCALQFKNNRCAEVNIIPAMIQQCAIWETCMNRDPAIVGRAKVGAELIAEVINSFVEPITWKTLIFTLTSLAFLTVFINALLSLYRAKHQPEPIHHPAPNFPPAAIFPSQHQLGHLSPGPKSLGRYQSEEVDGSPVRRRRLDGGGAAKIK